MRRVALALAILWGLTGAVLAQPPYAGSLGGGGSSSIAPSVTTTTCADTTVLFANAGFVGCDTGLTKVAGATGAVTFGGPISVPAGAAGTTSLNFGTPGTGLFGAATAVIASISGTAALTLAPGVMTVGLNTTSLPTGGNLNFNSDTIISRGGAAATLKLGASADVAAPVAQTLGVQSVVTGTSNTGGANFTFNASKSTGTGVGGKYIVQTTVTGTTGTAVNTNFPMLTLNPGSATTSTVQFGDGTNITTYDSCTGFTSSATGVIACTASAARFKTIHDSVSPEQASRGLDTLRAGAPTWDYLDPERFGAGTRVGLIADDVAAMDSRCIVKRDGQVADYWDRCVIAYLVADRQNLRSELQALRSRVDRQ